MRLLILGLLTIILTSCGELDNFDIVTKSIEVPDTVTINREFKFRLTLKNDIDKRIKLTIDKNIFKSIQFLPNWNCDNEYVVHRVPNPKTVDNDYQIFYLNKNDSLTYGFTGKFSTDNSDSLEFTIKDYSRVFKLKRQECDRFTMTLGGIWLPGDFNPFDAMEGYDFLGRQIEIRE